MPKDQDQFKKFERMMRQVVRAGKKENRASESFRKFLRPEKLRNRINAKKGLKLRYGNSESDKVVTYKDFLAGNHNFDFGFIYFEIDDLKMFLRAMDTAKAQKLQPGQKGVPIVQLLGLASSSRIKRANSQIRTAIMYRFRDNMAHIQVSASPKSKYKNHQVRIRFETWENWILNPRVKNWQTAARKMVGENISCDCSCADFQYRFRYWLTAWDAVIKPPEHDFPKIRNPRKGEGVICKHLIKALTMAKTPFAVVTLSREMQRQAALGGLGGSVRFLGDKDLKALKDAFELENERIKIGDVRREYADYKRAQKAFEKKKQQAAEKAAQKRKRKAVETEKKKTAAQAARAERAERQAKDALANSLRGMVDLAESMGGTKDAAFKQFAKSNNMPVDDVAALAAEYNIK